MSDKKIIEETHEKLNNKKIIARLDTMGPVFLEIINSIDNLGSKLDKDIEVKISFEAITADTGDFVAYGKPVWIKIVEE